MTQDGAKPTTTDAGIPVSSDEHSLTVGPDGPILLQDHYLIEQMANFNRERIPERQPHAKGFGAFGHFEVTRDVSAYTKAAVFQPGTKTDTLIRFSTVAGERGSPDTWRDPRGFALKFYTTEGNYDMVGNNTPVFFIRDPMKFQHFIRSQKRRADNGLRDHDMQWDFWTLSPESAHQVTWLMGDRGIPKNWRHMNGYSSHTYMWVNAAGKRFWVKYHFKTDQGIDFLTQDGGRPAGGGGRRLPSARPVRCHQAGRTPQLDAEDADHAVRGSQDLPLQPLRPDQGVAARRLPAARGRPADAEPQPDRLPHRDRAGGVRTEQPRAGDRCQPGQDAAGAAVRLRRRPPSPPGGQLQADPGQRAAVPGAQLQQGRARCGSTTCRTRCTPRTRRAARRRTANAIPRWPPGQPTASSSAPPTRCTRTTTTSARPAPWCAKVMDDAARNRLVSNVVGHLKAGVSEPVLQRAFAYWRNIDKEIGDRIAKGVTGG